MSSSVIKAIVDKHNTLRSDPKCGVTAKAMCKVVGLLVQKTTGLLQMYPLVMGGIKLKLSLIGQSRG